MVIILFGVCNDLGPKLWLISFGEGFFPIISFGVYNELWLMSPTTREENGFRGEKAIGEDNAEVGSGMGLQWKWVWASKRVWVKWVIGLGL